MSIGSEDAAPTLTLATLNLYHWAEPGIGWYGPGSGHDAASWDAKRAWLSSMLAQISPDLIGFQEVVSVESLRADCAAAGLRCFATVAEPHLREAEDGSAYYNRPVQAVASRWPMRAAAVEPDPAVSHSLGVSDDRTFRRPAIRAEIEHPTLGPVVAYVCHLKSPGVGVEDALIAGKSEPPQEAEALARWRLEALSRAHAAAAIQRQFEASQLYHAATADIAEDAARPVAILGDLNDDPASPALRALTPFAAFERDGGAHGEAGDPPHAALEAKALDLFRFVDAYRLSPRSWAEDDRPATHRSGASGDAIDFILVSAALRPGGRVASVRHRVHDRHFRGGRPSIGSDHAGVYALFTLSGA